MAADEIILPCAAIIYGCGQNDAEEEEKYQNRQLFKKNGKWKVKNVMEVLGTYVGDVSYVCCQQSNISIHSETMWMKVKYQHLY